MFPVTSPLEYIIPKKFLSLAPNLNLFGVNSDFGHRDMKVV